MNGKDLIQGAYDLHVHSAPDLLPRKMDDIDMAERMKGSGMAGYGLKSHFFCTSERAALMHKLYPEVEYIGGICLNSAVGGINPTAVEMAARSGAKIVWFPTCDGEEERKHTFSDACKKLPFWARIIIEMKDQGIDSPTIYLMDKQGNLKKEVLDVLDIIARHNLILATGHLSHEETMKLIPEAARRGVKNIVITHVTFPTTFYTVEEQKELLKSGAMMEQCFTTWETGKCDWQIVADQIRTIGPENVVLGTDLGQPSSVYPDEGMAMFADRLLESGFTAEEIRTMIVTNPRKLLGKAD